ncbi:acetoacetate--CoA ligase, partial [Pseudomonas aeruginosa]
HGGLVIHGRSDAVLNPGGVRIGTAEIYRQVEKVEEVLESIAIGQDWQGDVRVLLFVRLRDGVRLDEPLR